LDRDTVLNFLGTVSEEFFLQLTDRVVLQDVAGALVLLDGAVQEGKDMKQLMKDWMSHYRSLLITKYIKNAEDMLNMSAENISRLRDQSNQISLEEIQQGIITLSKTIQDARYSTQPRVLLELAIVTIATGLIETTVTAQSSRQPKMQSVKMKGGTAAGVSSSRLQPGEIMGESCEMEPEPKRPSQEKVENYDLQEVWNCPREYVCIWR